MIIRKITIFIDKLPAMKLITSKENNKFILTDLLDILEIYENFINYIKSYLLLINIYYNYNEK